MKLKTILFIVLGVFVAVLVGTNIYDFLKPSKKDEVNTPISIINYTNFEKKAPSIVDSLENYIFFSHFEFDVNDRSIVTTYVFKNDILIDSMTNIIEKSRTIDCRAYKTNNEGIHLIYVTALNQDEKAAGRYRVFLTQKRNNKWRIDELKYPDINNDSIMANHIKQIAVLR